MVNFVYLMLLGCSSHIHNQDLLNIEVGMKYSDVTYQLGEPYAKGLSQTGYYHDTGLPYLHEVYIYKTHANSSSYYRNCYLIFADKVLRQMNCN
jgi:hypothetical protein